MYFLYSELPNYLKDILINHVQSKKQLPWKICLTVCPVKAAAYCIMRRQLISLKLNCLCYQYCDIKVLQNYKNRGHNKLTNCEEINDFIGLIKET